MVIVAEEQHKIECIHSIVWVRLKFKKTGEGEFKPSSQLNHLICNQSTSADGLGNDLSLRPLVALSRVKLL